MVLQRMKAPSRLQNAPLAIEDKCVKRPVILVVDDHAATCKVLSYMLDLQGYQPECVANGQEALAWMEHACQTNQCPALILLDLLMPVMDGPTFLACLRTRWSGPSPLPPIILFTVDHTDHSYLGCTDILLKPFHIRNLLEKLGQVLGAENGSRYLSRRSPIPEEASV